MSTARRRLKSPRSLSGTSVYPTMVTLVNIMVMNGRLRSFAFHVNRPPHSWDKAISDLKLQGQGHGCGQRARSYNQPIIILTHLFISHQSDQQFLKYSYFEIWPWNLQSQGHEWGQRSRTHIVPSIQPMHFLFVSHQLDQTFLRYGLKCLTLKKHIRIFKNKIAKITVFNNTSPESNQVMTVTRAIKLPGFVVIWWVVLTLSRRQANFGNRCHSCYLGSRSWKCHPVHFLRHIYSLCQISQI